MKVYFLNLPFKKYFSRGERSPQVAHGGTLYFPVWLTLAAAMAEKGGFEISLLDAIADGKTFDDCVDWLERGQPDCLVIETVTASWNNDSMFITGIRKKFKNLIIVLVGSHVSALARETLHENAAVNTVVRGEYEKSLVNFLQAVENDTNWDQIPGISFRRENQLFDNPDAALISDLDEIPFASPLYKRFLDYKNYFFAAAKWPGVMLMTGRGCPQRCMWCVFNQTLHGRCYRFRSAENIVQEFEFIIENFHELREVWIEDDTFTSNKLHVHKVCELILKKKLKFRRHPFQWYSNARPPLDFETMQLMKQAGCRLFITGFESGSQDILDTMRKGLKLEQATEFMHHAKRAGILVHGCFVVGNPGENRQTMEETLTFANRLKPDSAQFYFIHPYPGTEYYNWAKKNGYLTTEDYSQWLDGNGAHRCVVNLPEAPAYVLQQFCEKAYKKYHLSPAYLSMKLKQLFLQPAEGIRSIKAGTKYFQYLFGCR